MANQLKCAQPETVVEVDLMILDFLAYEAATALFNENLANSLLTKSNDAHIVNRFADNKLQMAKSFSDLFVYNHAYSDLPSTISFRFNLMRFLERFTRQPAQCSVGRFTELAKFFTDNILPDHSFETAIERLGVPEEEEWKSGRPESRKGMLDALEFMHRALPLPTLSQLQRGKVDGLTAEETAELKENVGWPSLIEKTG